MVLEEESSKFNRVECLEVGMGLKVGCEVCNRICSLGIFGVCNVHGLPELYIFPYEINGREPSIVSFP